MPEPSLTNVTLQDGVFQATFVGGEDGDIDIWCDGETLDTVSLTAGDVRWDVPSTVLGLGVRTLTFATKQGSVLYTLVLRAGSAIEGDLAEDVALLRAELDLLKSAFRRHCAETAS